MNCQLENINVTQRDGRVTHLDRVYIRGSHVRLFIVPDMLRSVVTTKSLCMLIEKADTFPETLPCSDLALLEEGV